MIKVVPCGIAVIDADVFDVLKVFMLGPESISVFISALATKLVD